MKSIDWSQDLLVNVQAIDEQHKELYLAMDKLLRAVIGEQPIGVLVSDLKAVVSHTDNHCRDEESIMKKYRYPGFEPQKKDHDYFTRELRSMLESLEKEALLNDKMSEDLLRLSGFFSMHIRKLDIPLGRFINERVPND